MDPLKTKGVHLSFLQLYEIPTDRSTKKRFLNFHNPDNYYNYIKNEVKERIFVNRVGEFRSALKVRDLKEKPDRDPVVEDTMWMNFNSLYNNNLRKGKNLAVLPCIPSIIDIIPSKQRSYKLDLSLLPQTLATINQTDSKMSISIYYFPIGCAISRIGIFLSAKDYSLDPYDLVYPFKSPEKFFKAQIWTWKESKITIDGYITKIVNAYLHRFAQELSGSENEESFIIKSHSRYSIIDLVINSRNLDQNEDKKLIAKFLESTHFTDKDVQIDNASLRMRSPPGYEEGIITCGDKYGFIWSPPSVDMALRLLYRRYVRNLALLTMVQKSLTKYITLIESGVFEDQNNSIGSIKENIKEFLLLTIHHYLRIHRSFYGDENLKWIYDNLRNSMDSKNTIKQTELKLKTYLRNLDDPKKQSQLSEPEKKLIPNKEYRYDPPI